MKANILLVIPCLRESNRIRALTQSLHVALPAEVRLLVVDDGSGAEEVEQLKLAVGDYAVKALPENVGKGGAVYAGWEEAREEEWLAFVDADGSCSAAEVVRVLAMLHAEVDALLAARVKMLGRKIKRNFHRHLIGRVFATLVGTLLKVPVYDSQCGLKVVRRSAFEVVKPLLKMRRFTFDVELICALVDAGYTVREVPIDWHEVGGGKVHLLSDAWRMFKDVLKIRAARSSSEWGRGIQR
jgi:glycosyltransferase involved in cell wall biosynthesis